MQKNQAPCHRKELDFLILLKKWQRKECNAKTLLNSFCQADILDAARVLEFGKEKYAAWNWTRGMKYSVVTGSILRHLWKIMMSSEAIDDESELPHWGHIACNVIFLVHYEDYYKAGDDRPDIFSGKKLPREQLRK